MSWTSTTSFNFASLTLSTYATLYGQTVSVASGELQLYIPSAIAPATPSWWLQNNGWRPYHVAAHTPLETAEKRIEVKVVSVQADQMVRAHFGFVDNDLGNTGWKNAYYITIRSDRMWLAKRVNSSDEIICSVEVATPTAPFYLCLELTGDRIPLRAYWSTNNTTWNEFTLTKSIGSEFTPSNVFLGESNFPLTGVAPAGLAIFDNLILSTWTSDLPDEESENIIERSTIAFITPTQGKGIAASTNLVVDLTDALHVIDLDSVEVKLNNTIIYPNYAEATASFAAITNGYRLTINPIDSLSPNTYYLLVTVANDIGNVKLASLVFTVGSSTSEIESSKKHNQPFWFIHIEGFPYLFFTAVPSSWSVPSGWLYKSGLRIFPGENEINRSQSLDVLSGIVDAENLTISIQDDSDDTFIGLLSSRRNRVGDSAPLLNNEIPPGIDVVLSTESSITNASVSGGFIYLGTQTISYASRFQNVFSGCRRGRYSILDKGLNEVEWKKSISWDDVLQVKPLVSRYPTKIKNRIVTVYRNYLDPSTGNALDKSESQIRFRGRISAYGDNENHNGFDVSLESIIGLLDGEFFTSQATAPLQGISFDGETLFLRVEERYWNWVYDDGWEGALTTQGKKYDCEIPSTCKTLDEIIFQLNVSLAAAWVNDYLSSIWQASRTEDGKLKIQMYPWASNTSDWTQECAQYSGSGPMMNTFLWGLRGYIHRSPLAFMLGILEGDVDSICVNHFADNEHGWEDYRNQCYKYYGAPSSYDMDSYAWDFPHFITENVVSDVIVFPKNALWLSANLKPEQGWQTSLGDGSLFLVQLPEQIIYRGESVDFALGRVVLSNANYDANHLIGTRTSPDNEVKFLTSEANEEKNKIRQVWKPSCRQGIAYIDSSGQLTIKEGIPYLLLQILLSTGSKNYNTDYDILPASWGLGIPCDYVDIESFERISDWYPNSIIARDYIFTAPKKFSELLLSECQTLGLAIVLIEGKITCVPTFLACTANESTITIDNSCRVMVDGKAESTMVSSPESIINSIEISLDYDWKEDKFQTVTNITDSASVCDSGEKNSFAIENKGMNSSQVSFQEASITPLDQVITDRLFDLASETWIYTCRVLRKCENLSLGDIVEITDLQVINPVLGRRGIARHLGRVISLEYDEVSGTGMITVRMDSLSDSTYEDEDGILQTIPQGGNFGFSPKVKSQVGNQITVIDVIEENDDLVNKGRVTIYEMSQEAAFAGQAKKKKRNTLKPGDKVQFTDQQKGTISEAAITAVGAENDAGETILTLDVIPETANTATDDSGIFITIAPGARVASEPKTNKITTLHICDNEGNQTVKATPTGLNISILGGKLG